MDWLYFLLVFWAGMFFGFFVRTWVLKKYSQRTGTIFVTDDQGLKTFLLELDDDPEKIADEDMVIFTVRKDAPNGRG